jgi:hypothetical protein
MDAAMFAMCKWVRELNSIDQRLNYLDTWNFPDSIIFPS